MQRSNFQIVRQQPVLQQVVEEDVLRFIKDWRSTYGSMQTVGADTALLLTSQSSIDAAQLIQLRAVLARSLSQGTAAERAQTALDMTTYPALAATASATQLRSHVQACLAIDTALMRALEQYYTRSGSDSLLKAVRRACVWPGDRKQFQVVQGLGAITVVLFGKPQTVRVLSSPPANGKIQCTTPRKIDRQCVEPNSRDKELWGLRRRVVNRY